MAKGYAGGGLEVSISTSEDGCEPRRYALAYTSDLRPARACGAASPASPRRWERLTTGVHSN